MSSVLSYFTGDVKPQGAFAGKIVAFKIAGVKEAIESVGAKILYLPPYSPDFNPIELVFSKLKTLVRKSKVRKVEELWKKLGELCDVFTPNECKNYFKHAGYNGKTKFQTKI